MRVVNILLLLMTLSSITGICVLSYERYQVGVAEEVARDMHEFFSKKHMEYLSLSEDQMFKLILTGPQIRGIMVTKGETICSSKIVTVAITSDVEDVMTTVAHEHVHVMQSLRSNCEEFSPDNIEWSLPYVDRIWEIEARMKAPEMVQEYLDSKSN